MVTPARSRLTTLAASTARHFSKRRIAEQGGCAVTLLRKLLLGSCAVPLARRAYERERITD
jgi:hypothetical protein